MQQRPLSLLSEFNCDIYRLSGAENVVIADALSCPGPAPDTAEILSTLSLPTPPSVPGISYLEMSKFQQSCPKVQVPRQSCLSPFLSPACMGYSVMSLQVSTVP